MARGIIVAHDIIQATWVKMLFVGLVYVYAYVYIPTYVVIDPCFAAASHK